MMESVTHCTFGARQFLVVGCKPEQAWVRACDGRNFADVDGSIVATHMMLELQQLGLATTWVGSFDVPKLQSLCPALAGWDLIAVFPLGFAAEDAAPSERHFLRKTAEEAVTVL